MRFAASFTLTWLPIGGPLFLLPLNSPTSAKEASNSSTFSRISLYWHRWPLSPLCSLSPGALDQTGLIPCMCTAPSQNSPGNPVLFWDRIIRISDSQTIGNLPTHRIVALHPAEKHPPEQSEPVPLQFDSSDIVEELSGRVHSNTIEGVFSCFPPLLPLSFSFPLFYPLLFSPAFCSSCLHLIELWPLSFHCYASSLLSRPFHAVPIWPLLFIFDFFSSLSGFIFRFVRISFHFCSLFIRYNFHQQNGQSTCG